MRRNDFEHPLPSVEALESRRLMSTSVFLGGQCLPPANTPPTPTPTPTPTPNPKPGHHNNGNDDDHPDEHDGDSGGDDDGEEKPNPNPNPNPPPIDVVIPQVVGTWSGEHATADQTDKGGLTLDVGKTADGDLTAALDFRGRQRIRWSGQLLYSAKSGQLTMYYLSSTLVAKLSATLTVSNGAPSLQGTVEYFTRDGSYKATFSLQHDLDGLPNA